MSHTATMVLLAIALGAIGCGSESGTSTGAGGGGTGGAAAGGAGTGGSGGAEVACVELTDREACEAAGCVFLTGRLFVPPSDCTDTAEATTCAPINDGGVFFGLGYLIARNVPEGRIVAEYGYYADEGVEGYEVCGQCALGYPCDWCQCAD